MKKFVSVLSGVALAAAIVTAQAAESVSGVIEEVNIGEHEIVLEDGTALTLADGIDMKQLSQGKEVTVTYEMKGNEKIATSVEIKKDGN